MDQWVLAANMSQQPKDRPLVLVHLADIFKSHFMHCLTCHRLPCCIFNNTSLKYGIC